MSEHNHPPMTHGHGLQDGCPRCAEYVKEPTGLDAVNLTRIWRGDWHTRLDVEVFNVLYRSVVIMQKLSEAISWRDFDPALESIMEHTPHPRPDQYDVFEFGGRR